LELYGSWPLWILVAKSKIVLALSENLLSVERENRLRHQYHFGGLLLACGKAIAFDLRKKKIHHALLPSSKASSPLTEQSDQRKIAKETQPQALLALER